MVLAAFAAKRGETERFVGAPYHAPRRRLGEIRAVRSPVLDQALPGSQMLSLKI